jgi:integrase/recombinase XerD
MLSLYRRHKTGCKSSDDRASRKCRCAVWCDGTVEGRHVRRSLKTRSWERAEQIKREIENGTEPEQSVTFKHAADAFLADGAARHLHPSTARKYRLLCDRLCAFLAERGTVLLRQCTREDLLEYRGRRGLGPRAGQKELERLRAFFRFCEDNGWTRSNPAKTIKAPKITLLPRLPFSDQDVRNIIAQAKGDRELAFVLTLRHTGLRIGDASLPTTAQLSENRIQLYTTKAGTPVSVLIPESLAALLKKLPAPGGYFFIRGASTMMHTTADLWRRTIKRMCTDAGIRPGHPHRFRHTLAADLLSRGASVEDVAAILGNSPAVVTKHYSQWIKSRQDKLDTFIQSTWEPKLLRVK